MNAISPPVTASLRQGEDYQLPPLLARAYVDQLHAQGLYERACDYQGGSAIGGAGDEETHVYHCERFVNSATRIVRILADQHGGDFRTAAEALLRTVSVGRVALLDIPSGTGAASLALLGALAELRGNSLPSLPISVSIFAGDISKRALDLFEDLVGRLQGPLSAAGIEVDIITRVWNAEDTWGTSVLCDDWLEAQWAAHEYLVLVSAFSGASKSQMEKFRGSFERIAERMARRSSALLWVEPKMKSVSMLRAKFAAFIKHVPIVNQYITSAPSADYTFLCPVRMKSGIPAHLEILSLVEKNKP